MREISKAFLAVILCIATVLTNTACSTRNEEKAVTVKNAVDEEQPSNIGQGPETEVQVQELQPQQIIDEIQPALPENGIDAVATEALPFSEAGVTSTQFYPLSVVPLYTGSGSYGIVREYLKKGKRPSWELVRVEEMINYFSYDLPEPKDSEQISVITELAKCPWDEKSFLVMIALKGKTVTSEERPGSNLVFLIDVSKSIHSTKKLPLIKASFRKLVGQLGENDVVSIAVYGDASGIVIKGARGNEKDRIMEALTVLEEGGSTTEGEGLELAYKIAKENYIPGGNNRVVLVIDNDMSAGVYDSDDYNSIIENIIKEEISLGILAMDSENSKQEREYIWAFAEELNWSCAFVSNSSEADKALLSQLGTSPPVVARDVELQVEFNPAKVQNYHLFGYYRPEDGDKKQDNGSMDPAEILSGYSVAAFYGIWLRDVYKGNGKRLSGETWNNEWLEISLKYKEPDTDVSKMVVQTLGEEQITGSPSENFRFAAAVAEFSLILIGSPFVREYIYSGVRDKAAGAIGDDPGGYRRGFLELVDKAVNAAH